MHDEVTSEHNQKCMLQFRAPLILSLVLSATLGFVRTGLAISSVITKRSDNPIIVATHSGQSFQFQRIGSSRIWRGYRDSFSVLRPAQLRIRDTQRADDKLLIENPGTDAHSGYRRIQQQIVYDNDTHFQNGTPSDLKRGETFDVIGVKTGELIKATRVILDLNRSPSDSSK